MVTAYDCNVIITLFICVFGEKNVKEEANFWHLFVLLIFNVKENLLILVPERKQKTGTF